jgi:nicotinamidase-related amidase
MAETLLDLLHARGPVNKLSESALIVIDAQREYLDGKLPLEGIDSALQQIRKLLEKGRKSGAQIYFIRHAVGEGSPIFNPATEYFQIIDSVAPSPGEKVIDKHHANSFAQTDLDDQLKKSGQKKLIVTGFMTHACVSATVRSAAERGYATTIVANACATRDLPGTSGGTVAAAKVHDATLAALQDLFATVVSSAEDIPH